MRAAEIFFLARVTRAAMVDSETRNAWAMSAVLIPQTSRRVSATWASRARAGWQQVKMSRSRSSGDHVRALLPRSVGVGLDQQRQLRAQCLLPAQRVDRLASGGRGEPGAGIGRDAVARPGVQRRDVGVLDALLGEVDVAGDARRRGEHEGPLATVRVGHRGGHRGGDLRHIAHVTTASSDPLNPPPPT